jgi:ABC-2 type transport system ATP-binding protein
MNPLFELKNIKKEFAGVNALKDVSFSLNKGEIHGFLGPNGAGKTTTMKIMTGILLPTSGSITINGQNFFDDIKASQSLIGYLPETPPLYPSMTVSEYLLFVKEINSLRASRNPLSLDSVVEKLSLGDVKNRLIGNLSKGYKQRVGLAGALIHNPEILILDEPTAGLDPVALKEFRDLIVSLKDEHTILISSHILHEIDLICSKVTIINQGRVIKSGTIQDIKADFTVKQVLSIEVSDNQDIYQLISQKYQVEKFERSDKRWQIYFNEERDLRSDILKYLVGHNVEVLELTKEDLELEDIFVQIANKKGAQHDDVR